MDSDINLVPSACRKGTLAQHIAEHYIVRAFVGLELGPPWPAARVRRRTLVKRRAQGEHGGSQEERNLSGGAGGRGRDCQEPRCGERGGEVERRGENNDQVHRENSRLRLIQELNFVRQLPQRCIQCWFQPTHTS